MKFVVMVTYPNDSKRIIGPYDNFREAEEDALAYGGHVLMLKSPTEYRMERLDAVKQGRKPK